MLVKPHSKALEKMKTMTNLHQNYDCSEIAEDLFKSANKGCIYLIKPTDSNTVLVIENKQVMEYEYHEVYSDGNYVFDPRMSEDPIPKVKYFGELSKLNKNKTLQCAKVRIK